MSIRPDGSSRGPFWSAFERSNIPMALVDRDKRYVAANDAALVLYQYGRDDLIGRTAGRTVAGMGVSAVEADWQSLLRHNELYGERVITHPSGRTMRVTFAAHRTMIESQWLALFVTVSAKLEPDGAELITVCAPGASRGAAGDAGSLAPGVALTPREREVVRRVALGRSTPQIAADLGLSPATVRSHVRNAMVKAGAHTRAQLVALVFGEGLAGH